MKIKKISDKLGQKGFSLAEVMITVSLITVLALAVVNQMKLASSSKRDANNAAIINNLTDKLAVELSRESTCTQNFNPILPIPGVTPSPVSVADITRAIVDGSGSTIIQKNQKYGKTAAAGPKSSAGNASTIGVKTISLALNPDVASQVILSIVFIKYLLGGITSDLPPVKLYLNYIPDASGKILKCFNDFHTSAISAVRLSCQGNASKYIDATTAPPYGRCDKLITSQACPSGKYISKIQTDANGVLQVTCTFIQLSDCLIPGQFVTGFNSVTGKVDCAYPFPACAVGTMLVKNSTGSYACVKTNTGCTGHNAIKKFNTDGSNSVFCSDVYLPQTCSTFVQNIASNGTITCYPGAVKGVTCGPGQFVSNVDGTGQPFCTNYINLGVPCPAGEGATGFDSNGDITCQKLDRRLSCAGSPSPSGKLFTDCVNAGGVVQNRDGGTNSFCRMPGATCTGGFNACPTWGNSNDLPGKSCTDANSACAYSVQTRTVYGANVFQNPSSLSQQYATCYTWWRNSGPWNYSCSQGAGPLSPLTDITEVGCY